MTASRLRSGRGRARSRLRRRARSARRSQSARHRRAGLSGLLAAVALEDPRRREFAELVPDHVLGHVHRNELAAVVDGDRVADHVRNDRRAPRPGLDDLLLAGRVERGHLLGEVVVHERALLDGTRHRLRLRLAAPDDEIVRPLVVAGLETLRLPAPRRGRMPSARGLALAAAHRVIDRVHGHAAVVRPPAEPAVAAGLADRDVLVFEVADLADGGVTLDVDLTDLARGQAHLRVGALLGHQLRRGAGRADELPALAPGELDV